ncbi:MULTISPECIES: hypothetical protein [unclassified Flavobacterium]|uniref:hypothetical protein n=1 Tax=unclassified Flavobacterium TaxID=196869 RepID=UPI00095902E8|nr:MULTISPECIES: hypothetical protein [unclassified Flavobacterium]MBN9284834.1 hypothetical protein [Flavobacterium sp.]OJV71329.1 MAG: hypothetical protein BGO42_07895 [Flavobacterium sp. 40-81]
MEENTNIKTKVSFYFEGESKPFANVEEYEQLKGMLYITDDSDYETKIKEVDVDGVKYKVLSTSFKILKETREDHLKYGIDLALYGDSMPYNFHVSVFLELRK